jgi:transcriptional regulator with XRE-family HTH domain
MGESLLAAQICERFGARLAAVRKRMGFSQERLSLESGVARSYLSGVERGRRNIALVNIVKLADTLGVKPFTLLDFEDELQTV